MAGSKERGVVVCHLRYNSWLSLPQETPLHPSSQPTTPTPLTLLSTRHLCTPIRIDEIKAMSRGFSGDKQVKIICKCKILRSSMFILDNRK